MKVTQTLSKSVNPELVRSLGAGQLLYGWARRTKSGLEATERHVQALRSIMSREIPKELYKALGGDEAIRWLDEADTYYKSRREPYRFPLLGLPYRGPNNGKDSDGQYFDETTDFMDTVPPNLNTPVQLVHGTINNVDPRPVGRVYDRWYDSAGGWFGIELDPNDEEYDNLVAAHKAGKLGGSTSPLMSAYKANDQTGHIEIWQPAEISLVNMLHSNYVPVNRWAMAKCDEVIMDDYYGDPVFEQESTLREEAMALLNKLREIFSIKRAVENENNSVVPIEELANEILYESETMTKCATCPDALAEEAIKLKAEIAEIAEEAKTKCDTCPEAMQWVKAKVIEGKIEPENAFSLIEKYSTKAGVAEWAAFKATIEAPVIEQIINVPAPVKATVVTNTPMPVDPNVQQYAILTNYEKNTQNSVDQNYMAQMRRFVGLENK